MEDPVFDLTIHPVHLGLGATAVPLPAFTGDMAWYERYAADHADDGAEGRLVSLHTFDGPWESWEVHPSGEELVVCVGGTITLVQELDGGPATHVLRAGQAAVNPPGTWHTADVEGSATVLFVTAGEGTRHRPR
jgi:mannose-6-phosphate isomerase-like protein (cupin superfamily)